MKILPIFLAGYALFAAVLVIFPVTDYVDVDNVKKNSSFFSNNQSQQNSSHNTCFPTYVLSALVHTNEVYRGNFHY